MSLVANNPYRILGLVNPITSKDLTKRIQDLETFAEFGKVKSYPLDLLSISSFSRNLEYIQEASRRLESDEDKLINGLFGFYQLDSVDEMALEALMQSKVELAIKLWKQQIDKASSPKFSWLINLNVIELLKFEHDGFDTDIFQEIVCRYGNLISNHFDQLKLNMSLSSAQSISKEQIGKKLIDKILDYCSELDYQPFGDFNIGLLDNFSNYQNNLNEYAELKILQPCIQYIDDAIEVSRNLRQQRNGSRLLQKNDLEEIECLIYELDEYSNNYQVKNIINEYVSEAMNCSLFAFNELDDDEVALEIIDWATHLPSYGQVSEDVLEKKQELEEELGNRAFFKNHQPIIDLLDRPIHSLEDAANKTQSLKRMLANIPTNDQNYLKASNACVVHVMNYLIENYNQSFESFKTNKNIDWLKSSIEKSRDISLMLYSFSMDADTKERLYSVGSKLNSELADIEDFSTKLSNGQLIVKNKPADHVVTGSLYSVSEYLGFNANIVRILFVIGTFLSGFWLGVILYIILAVVMKKKQ